MAEPVARDAHIEAVAERFCREILPAVSRTFALSIRLLPGALGDTVRVAYLLCRIADTVEDEPAMPAGQKVALLDALAATLGDRAAARDFGATLAGLSGDAAHVRLAANTPLVLDRYWALPEASRASVERWVREMVSGMKAFTLRYPGGIRIATLDEYREYCYYVAGTVGYMLTELWREHTRSISPRRYERLWERSRSFGEALQTVNILKDVAVDATKENAIYIPADLLRRHGASHETLLAREGAEGARAALGTLVQLAWQDLESATEYLLTIPRRAVPVRLFCVLPLLFAYATLRDLTAALAGPDPTRTVKISRREVRSLTVLGVLAIGSNAALSRLAARVRAAPVLA